MKYVIIFLVGIGIYFLVVIVPEMIYIADTNDLNGFWPDWFRIGFGIVAYFVGKLLVHTYSLDTKRYIVIFENDHTGKKIIGGFSKLPLPTKDGVFTLHSIEIGEIKELHIPISDVDFGLIKESQ
jgi:hypothetical protein